jgi:hypothetical protein
MPSLTRRLRHRAITAKSPVLRAYWTRALLRAKARAGVWDPRMLNGHPDVNPSVRRFIMRGVAAGLICTSTTDGVHAPRSYHYSKRAADLGYHRPGTRSAHRALVAFQRREARHPERYLELYGPDNHACVRGMRPYRLTEGWPLEDLHDTHVHGATA